MKTIRIALLGIIMLMVLAACGGGNVDEATAEKYSSKAEEVITLLNNGHYDELYEMFDATMKTALPLENMAEVFTPVIEESGDFEKMNKSTVNEDDGLFITISSAKYSNKNRVYTITFNQDDEVAGLYVK